MSVLSFRRIRKLKADIQFCFVILYFALKFSKITEAADGHSNSYFQFQSNGSYRVGIFVLGFVNDNKNWNVYPRLPYMTDKLIYTGNQEPNPTGNVSLTLNSKRWLVVLALCILLSSKKSLEMDHMPRMNV